MIFRLCIIAFLSLTLLSAPSVAAIDGSFPKAWAGASGATNSFILPDAGKSPVALFEQGVTGRAAVLYAPPGGKVTNASYSGTLTLYDNGALRVFRGKGVPRDDGSIVEAAWIADGTPAATASITLRRPSTDPDAPFLYGDATVGSRKYPCFLVPQPYSKTVPFAGSATVPGPGNNTFFVIAPSRSVGTGTGFAVLSKEGIAKFAGTLADGSKVSSSVPILSGGGEHFLALAGLAGKGRFLGAWAQADIADPETDWRGFAMTSLLGQPPREGLDFGLARFTPPAAGAFLLPWTKGEMQIEFELLQPDLGLQKKLANGTLTFDGRNRLIPDPYPGSPGDKSGVLNGANASGLAILSFTLDARKGISKGKITYFNGSAVLYTSLIGALNQKSGVISGRMTPRNLAEPPGFFDVMEASQ